MAELNISKVFVLVPSTVENFDGAIVSANDSKIYFDVKNSLIWAKGQGYGLTATLKGVYDNKFATLIGNTTGDDSKSVRVIAQEVVDATIGIGEDAQGTIDKLKEVLDFFKEVSVGETGVALLANVAANTTAIGNKAAEAVLYKDGDEIPEGKEIGDVKTEAVAATGLYKYVDDKVSDKNVSATGESGDSALISAAASNNNVTVVSTNKLQTAVGLAETSIQTLTISGHSLDKNNNTITTAQLKTDILEDLSGNETGRSDNSNNITVTVQTSKGEVSSVSVNASVITGRVDDIENALNDLWDTYTEPVQSND